MTNSGSSFDMLNAEGSKYVTAWVLRNQKIKPESLDWDDSAGWLYAFVVDDKTVKYIGLTDTVLRSRLDHYSYGPQSTSKRVRQSIMFELKRGKSVSIFGRRESSKIRLQAEERRLIDAVKPSWNRL